MVDAGIGAGVGAAVHGEVEPGFEEVREAFRANLDRHGDIGAAVAVYVDGAPVVDLWGGVADPATGRAWERDTPGLVYSVTKGAAAVLVHLLVQRGEIDLAAPVARYWPEFAAAGKGAVTVAQLLSHQAGLPVPTEPLTRAEVLAGAPVVAALARQEPLWEPGTAVGYHALTFGWLVGELVRRVSGRSLGTAFAAEVAAPLGLDFRIGLPRELAPAVAALVNGVPDPGALDAITDPAAKELVLRMVAARMDPTSLLSRALSTNGALPAPDADTWNDPDVYAAEMPAANGITTARAVARMYAACVGEVDGHRLLTPAALDAARAEQVRGDDVVLVRESRFGAGFQLPTPPMPLLGEGSFGHAGAGGALGFADVGARVGFGYVPNLIGAFPAGDPRIAGLVDAVRRSLG